jgi:hypothetical protein
MAKPCRTTVPSLGEAYDRTPDPELLGSILNLLPTV